MEIVHPSIQMEDIISCPICENKLRTVRLTNKYLFSINKTSNYIERTCSHGMNHSLLFFTDENTKKIDFIKISLSPKYSRFIEIDFLNQKCRVACLKGGKTEYIDIPKMLEPDFPKLVKLKEKVAMYVVFS